MVWTSSHRKDELPPDWPQIRERILRRDRRRCQWERDDTGRLCGAWANQVDHINQSRNDDHSDSNLQSLCAYHHSVKSSGEGGRARAAARRQETRKHPGLRW